MGRSQYGGAFALAISFAIVGFGYQLLAKGGLLADTSPLGWTVKLVLLAVGLALVALPLKAMLAPAAKQKEYRKSLARGVVASGEVLADEARNVARAGAAVRDATRAGIRSVGAPAKRVGEAIRNLSERNLSEMPQ